MAQKGQVAVSTAGRRVYACQKTNKFNTLDIFHLSLTICTSSRTKCKIGY
jgi:hypothetical protein